MPSGMDNPIGYRLRTRRSQSSARPNHAWPVCCRTAWGRRLWPRKSHGNSHNQPRRLSGNQLSKALQTVSGDLPHTKILPLSARTGAGRDELWREIGEAAQARRGHLEVGALEHRSGNPPDCKS
jgi:ABC-type sugar transport system ATPase subunit